MLRWFEHIGKSQHRKPYKHEKSSDKIGDNIGIENHDKTKDNQGKGKEFHIKKIMYYLWISSLLFKKVPSECIYFLNNFKSTQSQEYSEKSELWILLLFSRFLFLATPLVSCVLLPIHPFPTSKKKVIQTSQELDGRWWYFLFAHKHTEWFFWNHYWLLFRLCQ